MANSREKIAVGLSGGVDSSVAAMLLLDAGYDVEGIFMKNWEEDDSDDCNVKKDYEDACNVCKKLGIKINLVNFSDKYWDDVFRKFIAELKQGYTPNPDIFCNKEIKFKLFFNYALSIGFDSISTGHYAKNIVNEDAQLHIPKDKNKDQTYFLYTLKEEILKKVHFPLNDLMKDEVKQIASDLNLGVSNKKESMGICFIGKRKFSSFVDDYIEPISGPIIDYRTNSQIGKHNGLSKFTIGQRKGINIGGMKSIDNLPWYVIDKDMNSNSLIVSQDQNPIYYDGEILLHDFNFINKEINYNMPLLARFRHGGDLKKCQLLNNNDKYSISLSDKERGIAAGQAAVLYNGTQCIGGGTISSKCLNKN